MYRPSRGRSRTFPGVFSKLFSPSKAGSEPIPAPETIGWRPQTRERSRSALYEQHVLSQPSSPRPAAARLLKQQLVKDGTTSDAAVPITIPQAEVTGGRPPSVTTTDVVSSPPRIAFVSKLLKPENTSESGSKLRQRAPSPYPDAQKEPTKAHDREPSVRIRDQSLDRVVGTEHWLALGVHLLGSTPPESESYVPLTPTPHPSRTGPYLDDNGSDLSDAETLCSHDSFKFPATSNANRICEHRAHTADTITGGDSLQRRQSQPWKNPRRPCTPAAWRPPLERRSRTWAHSRTRWYSDPVEAYHDEDSEAGAADDEDDEDDEEDYISPPETAGVIDRVIARLEEHEAGIRSPSTSHNATANIPTLQSPAPLGRGAGTPTSWLPTDPSICPAANNPHLPQLLWLRDIDAEGLWFSSTVHPPPGVTAGESSEPGPSHTPQSGFRHVFEETTQPPDPEELKERLRQVQCARAGEARSACEYDRIQQKIRERYASWDGGESSEGWPSQAQWHKESLEQRRAAQKKSEGLHETSAKDAGSAEGEDALGAFPRYESAEHAFAQLDRDELADSSYELCLDHKQDANADPDGSLALPNYAAAMPVSDKQSRKGGTWAHVEDRLQRPTTTTLSGCLIQELEGHSSQIHMSEMIYAQAQVPDDLTVC